MYRHRTHHRVHRPQPHGGSLYGHAHSELDDVLYDVYGHGWEHVRIERLGSAIDEMKRRVHRSDDATQKQARWIALLLLQTPRAVRAQNAMDARHGGYRHRHKRLFELIDFNDAFVDTVLSLHRAQREEFGVRIFQFMRDFCHRTRTQMFTPEQFDAIIRGLSREIAVYLGAQEQGFDVYMSSRVADGLGIDMQIRWPASGRYVSIDCKTTSAYLHRVEDLRREGRLAEHEVTAALTRGYVRTINGHRADRVKVVLFSVVPEVLGELKNFEFPNTELLAAKLHEVLDVYGERGEGFGKYRVEEV